MRRCGGNIARGKHFGYLLHLFQFSPKNVTCAQVEGSGKPLESPQLMAYSRVLLFCT